MNEEQWSREQRAADRSLRELFDGTSPPELSPSFDAVLSRRIGARCAKRSHGALVMKIYWLAAGLATAALLPSVYGAGLWAAILVPCLAVPLLLLVRMFRLDPVDLIACSVLMSDKRYFRCPSQRS